eukprot:16440313-Heterocapsa_arctica.AAC.1
MNEHLRQTDGYAPKVDTAIPLGELGGVPPLAADVPLSRILQRHLSGLSRQVEEPSELLLPPRSRPAL